MILIDSLYINNSGGKILLDYLVQKIEESNISAFYLFDLRCLDDFSFIPNDRKIFLKASLYNRHVFYLKNGKRFEKIFCFGNLPPTIKFNVPVYTYLHQPMYLNIPKEFSLKQKVLFRLKMQILNFFKTNTTYWYVQNDKMKKDLSNRYGIDLDKILLVPFYPNEDLLIQPIGVTEKNTFIYASGGSPHKNHIRLIDAFCSFYDQNKTGKLILTISNKNKLLYSYIEKKIKDGYPIENIGFVNRSELIKYYQLSEYTIYPSIDESFGLGIIEAIECGCKVIGADLQYMYQVCKPSLVFNPFESEDIKKAFVKALNKEEEETKKIIDNEIIYLIKLIKTNLNV